MFKKLQYIFAVIVVLAGFLITAGPVAAQVTVNFAGTGSGTVAKLWSAGTVPTIFTTSFSFGSSAGTYNTLTATPATGSTFEGWSGGGCSGTGTCIPTDNSTVTVTFTATQASTYSISGQVTSGGTGLSGVAISVNTTTNGTTTELTSVTTDASGNYTITGLSNGGSYWLIPRKNTGSTNTYYSFSPDSQTVTISGANATQNFTATLKNYLTISGRVTSGGSGLSGVTLTAQYFFFTVTATTDANGNYTLSGSIAEGQQWPVTPSKTGYTFTPASLAVTVGASDVTGQNFTATSTTAATTYNITTSAGTGGSISPTSATVNSGSTKAFTITPDSGYSIASVTGCGGTLSGNTYTTGAVTADCTVVASFSQVCTYSFSSGSQSFDSSGGTGSVTVTSANGCSWTAVSNTSWASITSGSNGSGIGTVSFTVASNTGSGRSGSLTVEGHTFTISQTALQYSLVLTKSGTGAGAISSGFSFFSSLLCGTDCQVDILKYDAGTNITLSAAPETGTTFKGWSGGGCSGTAGCTVTLTQDTSINAVFTSATAPATDSGTARIVTKNNDTYVNVPVIKYVNSSDSTTTYYSTEFVYVPTSDNKIWLKLTKADKVTDLSPYSGSKLSQFYPVGNNWMLHLATLQINGTSSVWADLQYTPTNDGYSWFVVTGSGEN